jgi:hypothetical protein
MDTKLMLQPGFREVVSSSPFVLACTVKRLGASNVTVVPAAGNTAVLRVDDVIWAAPMLGMRRGSEITVRLTRGTAKVGLKAVFFATSWIYGDVIAVEEVDRLHLGARLDAKAVRRAVAAARLALADDAVVARLAEAPVVIGGHISKVEPAGKAVAEPDDPQWHVALVAVQSIEKGKVTSPEVKVFFPANPDGRWETAPKFHVGQEGFFILREARSLEAIGEGERRPRERRKREPVPDGYTALDPLDYQLPNQAERLRALLVRG